MNKCKLKQILYNRTWLSIFAFGSVLIFGLFVLTLFSSTVFAHTVNEPVTVTPRLSLTADEQAWLAEHQVITLGGGIYPPLNFIDADGKSIGIAPDYLNLIAQRLGIKINMVSGDWSEIQTLAKEHNLDGLSLSLKNRERDKYLDFAGPYTTLQYAIFVNKETQGIANLDDLMHKRVGVLAGDYSVSFINENYPDIDLVLYNTHEEIVYALVNREINALLENLASISYIIDKSLITGLKVAGLPNTMHGDLYVAVRKDWPQFTAILNKVFASISKQQHQIIKNKWIALYSQGAKKTQLTLTMKQTSWLAEQHVVRVRVSELPPYMIIKAGRPPEGIAIDYLNLIAQRTGIKFRYEVSDQPFNEFLGSFKRGQDVDFTALIVPRRERLEYMLFSDNYIESPTVIATRDNNDFSVNLQGLAGKLVAVLKAGNVQHLLSAQYPNITLALYNSNELALEALTNGNVDAFVGSLTNAAYIIQKRGFSNIHIDASSSLESEYFAMANRKDWPELTEIVNIALLSISEKEKIAIRNKYVALNYQVQGVDLVEVLLWISAIFSIALIIVLFFVTWNRSLRKLVNSRTVALQREVVEREQAHNALLESQKESLKAQRIARLGYWKWDLINDQFHCSDEIYRILGLPIGTLLNYEVLIEYIHPDDHDYFNHAAFNLLKNQNNDRVNFRVIQPEGSVRHVSTDNTVTLECDEAGNRTWMFGILQDVTELKESEQKLINYQQRLKSLALQLALVEEQERRHIAADLHDNVGQSLALTRLQLAAVLKRLPDDKKTAGLVHNCSQLILTVIQETRHLIFEISSPSLNEFGLAAAIIEWKEQTCKPSHGLDIKVIDRLAIDFVSLDLRAIIFRNVRELLINVIKHAKATEVVVNLEEKSGCYLITVKDNGIGFIVDEQAGNVSIDGGFGLFSIQERMIDLGGQLIINAKPQEGCTVIMALPVIEIGTQ
jgi:PAS domain S-box-containing protein